MARIPNGPVSNLSGGSDNFPPPLQRPSPNYGGGTISPHMGQPYRLPHPGVNPQMMGPR